MTHTATIAVSISPITKILQDYFSESIFAEFLPAENRTDPTVLNYLENVKVSKNTSLYWKLIFSAAVVYLHPLFSFKAPFPYLSEQEKTEELHRIQCSHWQFLRSLFSFIKSHALIALFKDINNRRAWKAKPVSTPINSSLKSIQNNYDYIVLGKNGAPAAAKLSSQGKNVLWVDTQNIFYKSHKSILSPCNTSAPTLKKLPKEIYEEWDAKIHIKESFSYSELENSMQELEKKPAIPNCDSVSNFRIEKILFENHKAVALETSEGIISAKEGVILSMGAIETPALLLRSGLSHLEIGRNFQANLSVSCLGLLPEERVQMEGPYARIEISQFEKMGFLLSTETLSTEKMLSKLPFLGNELNEVRKNYSNLTSWMASIKAKAKGRVSLTTKGVPYLFYDPTYEDMEAARSAMNKLCQILFQLNAKEVYPGLSSSIHTLKTARDTAKIRTLSPQAQYFKMELLHGYGTCRMGKDPKKDVVSRNFRVSGTENLYCTDTSIFPTSISQDPTLTAMAFSKLLADRLV